MISGRSLGHTGGTLDKLEDHPRLPHSSASRCRSFLSIIQQCGFAMVGQTPTLVPADRILYSLRDHTGTVESPYLITASIMSKKLAAGLNALVLDVKTGSGAFMSKYADAQLLARLMVETGELAGTRTVALLTSMDQPLGRFSGNWVEVQECAELFHHFSPDVVYTLTPEKLRMSADLLALTHALAGHMLYLAGKGSHPAGRRRALRPYARSTAPPTEHFLQMVKLQSDDYAAAAAALADPAAFHKPIATRVLAADRAGYLSEMNCTQIGWAVQRLGAGRTRPGDPVSAHAGIEMHAKLGDRLEAGQPLITLFSENATLLDEPEVMLRETLKIAPTPPQAPSRLIQRNRRACWRTVMRHLTTMPRPLRLVIQERSEGSPVFRLCLYPRQARYGFVIFKSVTTASVLCAKRIP